MIIEKNSTENKNTRKTEMNKIHHDQRYEIEKCSHIHYKINISYA